MKKNPINVVLIEDNEVDARLIQQMLDEAKDAAFSLDWADTLSHGLDRVTEGGVDVILLDLNLPESRGVETFSRAHQAYPLVPIIPLTGLDDEELAAKLVRAGAQDYLVKGEVGTDLLASAIRYAIERKKAEQALRESEQRYRSLFESTGTAIVVLEQDFTIHLANTEFEKLTGYSKDELEGKMSWKHFVAETDLLRVPESADLLGTGSHAVPQKQDVTILDRNRNTRHAFMTWAPIPGSDRQVVSLVDITDHKKMEEELLKARKLESVGILAGGIAHDFNNSLTAILGNISLAQTAAGSDPRLVDRLGEAEKGALRAQELTRQLLTFAKGGAPVKQTVSLGEVARKAARLALAGSNVKCETYIQDELWPAQVDEGQMGQAINNLLINATEAMASGGTVKLHVKNVTLSRENGGESLPLEEGRYVQISILDQGTGISKFHLAKIFDPYFTTKPGGSGLGLAIAHSVVEKHSGTIAVKSVPGVGTAFKIYLPASDEKLPTKTPQPEKIVEGFGRILVMDDEEIIRMLVSDLLTSLGYVGDFAADGEEAIRLYKEAMERNQPYDAVIMDLTIPGGMGGKEAMEKLLVIDPKIKAIVSSGYANDPIMADHAKYGFSGVMPKPYRIEEFSRILAQVSGDDDT
jgi:two-component system cell cycle sensor histidine kinase/response regulator CckA